MHIFQQHNIFRKCSKFDTVTGVHKRHSLCHINNPKQFRNRSEPIHQRAWVVFYLFSFPDLRTNFNSSHSTSRTNDLWSVSNYKGQNCIVMKSHCTTIKVKPKTGRQKVRKLFGKISTCPFGTMRMQISFVLLNGRPQYR